ncbi:EAL and HDOD domain-containing protein [Angustibacter peucedani]
MTVTVGGGSGTSSDVVSPLARIARQAIHDRDGAIVAHELLFRGGSSNAADLSMAAPSPLRSEGAPSVGDLATSQVITSTFGDFGVDQLGNGKPLFINLTRAFLVGSLPMPFGPSDLVLEVLEDVAVDDELLEGVRELRSRGFRLAVDDFVGEEHRRPLLGIADVVKIEVTSVWERLGALVAQTREDAPGAQLLAERVEDAAMLQTCLDLGFDLFQGYHFHRPTMLQAARLSPTQLGCLQLLRVLNDPDATTSDIERAVAGDPGLSLRVLGTANSAGVASTAQRQITSLRQAVVLLGPAALSAWVMLTLVGGSTGAASDRLATVIARAACCRLVADRHRLAQPGEAYTAGLLSGVAWLLGADVRSIAEGAGLPERVVDQLVHGHGPLGAVLDAVTAHELGDPLAGPRYGVSAFALSRAYLESWSAAVALVSDTLGT